MLGTGAALITHQPEGVATPTWSFVQTYLEWAHQRTEAPTEYHRFCALAACCAALAKRSWIDYDWGRVYPSMWIMLIGESGMHKSTATKYARTLLTKAVPNYRLPQTFSVERIMERLSPEPSVGYIEWPEVARAFPAITKEYNADAVGLLIEMWDHGEPDKDTKSGGKVVVSEPALTILAGGKPIWFRDDLRPMRIGGLSGGFFGRWMYVYEDENRGYRSSLYTKSTGGTPGLISLENELVAHLHNISEAAPRELDWPLKCIDMFDDWAQRVRRRMKDAEDPAQFCQRAQANVAKLTMGIMASDFLGEMGMMRPEALKRAILLWEKTYESGQRLVAEMQDKGLDREGEALERVRGIIQRLAGRKIDGEAPHRRVLQNCHMSADHLNGYIKTLMMTGEIKPASSAGGGTVYVLKSFPEG